MLPPSHCSTVSTLLDLHKAMLRNLRPLLAKAPAGRPLRPLAARSLASQADQPIPVRARTIEE